jgi:oligopeptide/dipeptide ABC transporter ATP-binding protein
MTPLLEAREVSVDYLRRGEKIPALREASFTLSAGETLGLVGESGSGKSTLALALFGLLPENAAPLRGRILFEGRDLAGLDPGDLRRLRRSRVGHVFQDPFSALNPVLTLGEQMAETGLSREGVRRAFARVHLPDPAGLYRAYPHQISGGQRQRVCLAMALAADPPLLIADEPTTALDVTLQKEILDLLDELKSALGLSILFVTHNMGLLAERADRLAVMYAGRIVETGPAREVLSAPMHPYTEGLIRSLPRLGTGKGRLPQLSGQPPDPRRLPGGCAFHPRCPKVFAPCARLVPPLFHRGVSTAACHLYAD